MKMKAFILALAAWAPTASVRFPEVNSFNSVHQKPCFTIYHVRLNWGKACSAELGALSGPVGISSIHLLLRANTPPTINIKGGAPEKSTADGRENSNASPKPRKYTKAKGSPTIPLANIIIPDDLGLA